MEDVTFKINLTSPHQVKWVVYSLHDDTGAMQFMGICQWRSLMSVPDARKHPMFAEVFGEAEDVWMKIHKTLNSKPECQIWMNRYMRDKPRPFMMQYRSAMRGKVAVRCIETGEHFESITDCATAHGLSSSALSNHLSGNPSYKSVGGRTYEHLTQGNGHAIAQR